MQRLFLLPVYFCFLWLSPVLAQINSSQPAPGFSQLVTLLAKNSFQFDHFDRSRIPLLMGNAHMGGLADPMGRGFYEIMCNEYWTDSLTRMPLPGLMLVSAQLGLSPLSCTQKLDIRTGILNTVAAYGKGYSYRSESFFNMSDPKNLILKLKNTGSHSLRFFLRLPYEGFYLKSSDSSRARDGLRKFIASNSPGSFTHASWSLESSSDLELLQNDRLAVNVEPGDSIVLSYSVYADRARSGWIVMPPVPGMTSVPGPAPGEPFWSFDSRMNAAAWDKLWNETARIILPSQDRLSKAYYRSLYWMFCIAGGKQYPANEVQFASLSTPLAQSYGYYTDSVRLDVMNWNLHSFTYGASGWACLAATGLGNETLARKILDVFDNLPALRYNATHMFPFGKAHVYNRFGPHIFDGADTYLSHDNPLALCYGHELDANFHDYAYGPHEHNHWDWQLHLDGFAAALFVKYWEETGDRDYLEKHAYPIVRGLAEFYSEMLHYSDSLNAWTLPHTLSLAEDHFERSPIESMLAARWTLEKAAGMAILLRKDAGLQKKWMNISRHVYIPQNKDFYLEWQNDPFTRDGGGYEGIRGFCYFGYPTTELLHSLDKNKMRHSLDNAWERNHHGGGMVSYSVSWAALTELYLKNIPLAMQMLDYDLDQYDLSGTAYLEVKPQKAYYHPSGILNIIAVNTMLIQSTADTVELFPAPDPAWKDVSFYDLPAGRGLRVSAQMKAGRFMGATFSLHGKEILHLSQNRKVKIIRHPGEKISLQIL